MTDLRKTIIDILLATRSLSEGVAADAILSAIGSGAEPVDQWKLHCLEYIGQDDPEAIDSDDYEIYLEDDEGRSGTATVSISELCKWAAERLHTRPTPTAKSENFATKTMSEAVSMLVESEARIEELKKALQAAQDSKVPEGWKTVELGRVTSDMKAACIGEYRVTVTHSCSACAFHGSQDECEVCAGDIEFERNHDIPWDTVKRIYKDMLSAAPSIVEKLA